MTTYRKATSGRMKQREMSEQDLDTLLQPPVTAKIALYKFVA